jgi:hypothetical protein
MEVVLPRLENIRSLPTSSPEIVPLLVGLVGISIPVGLLALAATGGSTIVLVLAVLMMIVVAGATLTFMFMLTDDQPEELHGGADA